MSKLYQKPRARFIQLSSESLLANSPTQFEGSTNENFTENDFLGTQTSNESFSEAVWGRNEASN